MKTINGVHYSIIETDVPGAGEGAQIIAFKGNTVVGIEIIGQQMVDNQAEHAIFLWNLYVKPEYRGHGIGANLIRSALEWNEAQNDNKTVWFTVNDAAKDLIPYYKRLGFIISGQFTDSEKAIVMTFNPTDASTTS